MSWWSWIDEPYPFIGEHSLPPGWWGKRIYESSYYNWYIYTLFDDDFLPCTKAIKDWILESTEALESYFKRPVKIEEVLRKHLGFIDGIRYFRTILLSELVADQGKSLEDAIMEDLAPLVSSDIDGTT